jgi:hypothetical protein
MIGQNEPMRRLKYLVNYGTFIEILQNFPDIAGSSENLTKLQAVRDMAAKELERPPTHGDQFQGLLHGDFCMLKYANFL